MIKLIGFEIYGHSLFKDGTSFTLETSGQITNKTKNRVIRFNDSLTLNRVIGIVGINATGKSTLMEIFDGLNSLYLLGQSIDQTPLNERLRSKENKITVKANLATNEDDRYVVVTTFEKVPVTDGVEDDAREWIITNEKVYYRKTKRVSKKKYFRIADGKLDSTGLILDHNRNDLSKSEKKLLSDKDSIFRATDKPKEISAVISTVKNTNQNKFISFMDQTPIELLTYLDNSIDYLDYEKDDKGQTTRYALKFKDSDEVIKVSNFKEFDKYLSSGTIKGVTLFFQFLTALRVGATLMVDEIELHINKQIVRDFIGFFADPTVNVNNATLVYSSHYIELTDDLQRNDEEYILIRKGKTQLMRLNEMAVRPELKK
ncbi:AAA family ATPase [Lentilactobacillus kisonensis]|uniref:AAA family ATPase n=1 Tax=Lentilactobacillus kisonensis TaxID=481722 RepID=UPI000A43E48F|nr:AAA family ATPase [Lentilactobacillus kisonensis]